MLDEGLVSTVSKPGVASRVYKDECMFSFDTPESPQGIYLNLNTFQSFGSKFLDLDRERTGGRLYLHITAKKVPNVAAAADAAPAPVTVFAIGVEGGFQTEDTKWKIEKSYEVVQFPGPLVVPYPSAAIPAHLDGVIAAVIAHTDANVEDTVSSWQETREVTRFFESLIQLPDAPKVSPNPKDWQCQSCDVKENLWLNLSDGFIGCSRKQLDGTGGNGHALAHFEETGRLYPLCVKLGTITPAGGDVYSYDPTENDMVEDPNLAAHLAKLGINMMAMEKTGKTMAELNIDHNLSHDWSKIVENNGKDLVPRKGPGFVGLTNLGNSCYVNSVLQVLFTLPEFIERYYTHAAEIFRASPALTADDLVTQLAKVAVGVLSSEYVHPAAAEGEPVPDDTVAPARLKALVGRGHVEFSSNRQQDALEYLQHILQAIKKSEKNAHDPGAAAGDVSRLFEFKLEDKLRCEQSSKFRLKTTGTNVLSLSIPLDEATNLAEVAAYEESKAAKKQKGEDGSAKEEEPVRHIVPFDKVLAAFASPEFITGFRSPATGAVGNASKTQRFVNFPRYLVLNLRRYILGADWSPVKLEALVRVPEELDLEPLRATGLLPGEEPLPEAATPSVATSAPVPDPDIVASIIGMGFSENAAKRAALAVSNSGAEAAMEWVFSHGEDPDFNDPLPAATPVAAAGGFTADPESVAVVMSMGFEAKYAELALKETGGAVDRAVDWLFSRSQADYDAILGAAAAAAAPAPAAAVDDGPGVYDLVGFISHLGKNTGSGHYVCHIKKDGKWTFFNDSKVAFSDAPPFDMGYIYLFRRRT